MKSWLHCNHILFGPFVRNYLLAINQTLLIIAYLFTRFAFSDTALRDVSRDTIKWKTLPACILDKNIRRLLKSWLHCNHILFSSFVSNFLFAINQTFIDNCVPIYQTCFFRHCVVGYFEKHHQSKNALRLYP